MGTSEIALERIQALLKIDAGGGAVNDHLVRLSRKLAENKPGEALAQLETLSHQLKQSSFRGRAAPDEAVPIVSDAQAEDARLQWCSDVLQLVRPPPTPTAEPKVTGVVQNFAEDAAMLRWAGVGFGQQEAYHIAMSLRKLASETPSIERLRFWGKVLGSEADYYVVEGVLKSAPRPPDVPPAPAALPDTPDFDVEPRGEGANSFTYWVSAGGCAPWVRLPAARASHIVAARSIKYLLTGNLDNQVLSMPWFPGKERHFLRAQIARISASCNLAVRGWYEPDEEAGENNVKESEDPAGSFPAAEELETEAGWVHRMPCLNKIGKCSFPNLDELDEALTDSQKKVIQAQIDAEGDPKGVLSGIDGDLAELKPEGEEGNIAWSFKVFGDRGLYKFGDTDKSHRVTAARSLLWPGAIAVAQGTKFANLYIGYGQKCGALVPSNPQSGLPLDNTSPFFPLVPAEIMDEPQDLEEHDEPNPNEDDAADEDNASVDEDPDAQ